MCNLRIIYVGHFDLSIDDGKSINEREVVGELLAASSESIYVGPSFDPNVVEIDGDRCRTKVVRPGVVGEFMFQLWLLSTLTALSLKSKTKTVICCRPHYFSFSALIISKILGVPRINKEAGIPNWFLGEHSSVPKYLMPMIRWLRVRNVVTAERLWCVNSSIKRYWIDSFGVSEEKIFVIANGVNTKLFGEMAGSIELPVVLIDQAEPDLILLYAGNLYHSGLVKVVEAINLLSMQENIHVRLVIAGDGEDRIPIENSVRKYGLDDHVIFLGWVPYTSLPSLYEHADILCATFTNEFLKKIGFRSQKIFQYVCSGTAVLAGKCPDHSFITENEFGLLADADSADDLAEKILCFYHDPKLGKRNAHGVQWVNDNASYKIVAGRLLNEAGKLVNEH